jgi:catechol 2,3-dioxygenase-like lactoylglutathione lyase family enzyme
MANITKRSKRVTGLHRLTLRVPDVRRLGEFYRDVWGTYLVHAGEDRWDLQCRDSVHVDLSIVQGEPTGLASLALRIDEAARLGEVLAAAERAGATVLEAPARSRLRSDETVAAFADLDGNRIELVWLEGPRLPAPRADRGFGPRKLGHVVLWTPRIEAMESFYAAIGLQVTDRTAIGMSFLRCNADHHSVALVRSKGRTGMQHVAYDVGTIDAVMREKGRLTAAGLECIWGPGRHGPGNNVFSYYRDPAGNIIEFYGELQQFPEGEPVGEPVYWGPEHRGDIWGLAGPPPAEFHS